MNDSPSTDPLPRVAIILGRAGLLPFCAGPLAIYLDPHHAQLYGAMLASYALAIISFLVGIWWGLALIRRSAGTLVLSNAIVVIAFFGQVLLSSAGFFLLCALLYPATVWVERSQSLFRPQPTYYAHMRLQLTVVATATLLLCAVLL